MRGQQCSDAGISDRDWEFTKSGAALVELNCVGKAGREVIAVSDAEQSCVIFGSDFQQQTADLGSCFRIQIPGGFVGQQQGWLVNQSPAHRHSLPFAAGKTSGPLVQTVRKSHTIEQ